MHNYLPYEFLEEKMLCVQLMVCYLLVKFSYIYMVPICLKKNQKSSFLKSYKGTDFLKVICHIRCHSLWKV